MDTPFTKGPNMHRYLFLLILFLHLPAAHADIYEYTDPEGVLSFTDNLEKVPPAQRPRPDKVEPPPPLLRPVEAPLVNRAPTGNRIDPLIRYVLPFLFISFLILFAQSRSKGFLIRLTVRLLVIGFLGGAIYTYTTWNSNQKTASLASLEKVEASFPNLKKIRSAKKEVRAFEEKQDQQRLLIESLWRTEGSSSP